MDGTRVYFHFIPIIDAYHIVSSYSEAAMYMEYTYSYFIQLGPQLGTHILWTILSVCFWVMRGKQKP